MKNKLFLFLSVLNLHFVSAQSIEKVSVKDALSYMNAYSDWNIDKMKEFYSDSIHFHDPTAVEAFRNNYNVKGKEKVVALLKGIFSGSTPKHISFKVKEHFTSGSFIIINSTFTLIVPTSWFGKQADGKIFVSVPAVTVLRFSKGKIISHKDYFDYDSYKKQIALQLKTKK